VLRSSSHDLLVLSNADEMAAYWQLITPETAIPTRKRFKVEVPSSQSRRTTSTRG
jgi:hypothetical protein